MGEVRSVEECFGELFPVSIHFRLLAWSVALSYLSRFSWLKLANYCSSSAKAFPECRLVLWRCQNASEIIDHCRDMLKLP